MAGDEERKGGTTIEGEFASLVHAEGNGMRREPPTAEEIAARGEAERREGEADPAPVPSQIAAKRSGQLVDNVTDQAMLDLARLRDQIDDLMRDMIERREAIKQSIMGQAEFVEQSMTATRIIGEHVQKLRTNFEASLTPLPASRRRDDA